MDDWEDAEYQAEEYYENPEQLFNEAGEEFEDASEQFDGTAQAAKNIICRDEGCFDIA